MLSVGGADPITVDGYASSDGPAQRNKQLALARAQAVAGYLAGKGIPAARIKATGHGATAGFSKDDAAANRRATLRPKPAAPPGPPPKPQALTLTHQTEATAPSNRQRTKLGVGERVTLKVAPGSGTWAVTKGKLSKTTGATVIFTAPGN